ncbi:hypothetical protein E4U03_00130 [Rothia nasimurium]|uniref:Spore protein YkvP/CgeB glycosyl transferase-like domain-containing protein n=1 Tax=Rothia nasimurium TaxID=85336 RepID=A0A4Y9F8G0_9MICC|nr:glycosyltransferase [Rothia nasimurium]MBF0807034.1 glycosyltransferase [Rothia nasimurium]TFU24356.1 hypothetical protein E4U03_00130 [Rothia nasimurium]
MAEKLLIISPAFHGYCYSIAEGFTQLGYDVTVHRYDAFDTVKDKLRNKALYELPSKVGFDGQKAAEKAATAKALQVLRNLSPDKLIVIKGDALGDSFWQAVADRKIPYILWLYDDLKRCRYTKKFLQELPLVVSYARTEAEELASDGINAHFVANGYDPALAGFPQKRNNEIVFVGSRYKNREEMIVKLSNSGVPVRAYGRAWSHHPFDRLRTWEIKRPNIPSERDITLAQAYEVQASAAAALNIHGLQAGLAMRTFEVPGMNGLQLIDRPDVEEFYDVGSEVLVYQSTEDLIELCQRIISDPTWSDSIRAAGLKRSQAEHTFFHRAQKMDTLWV